MPKTQKTYSPKASEVTHAWRLVDADGQTLGRLASRVAGFLRGKHRPNFSEHMDMGDYVVVVNAARVRVTGNKARDRIYYRHSTYPGGLKQVALGEVLAKHPDRLLKQTVKGMLPHNALGRKMLRKLKVYAGPDHPHEAQFRASDKLEKSEEQSA
ncbi:MAG: 50S ribosomal protein L13 [Chloroflexota bacterium]|nr:50S ribosomal protein L13 [Chloroflexota bacterium]